MEDNTSTIEMLFEEQKIIQKQLINLPQLIKP
jgi:hypothetical protein